MTDFKINDFSQNNNKAPKHPRDVLVGSFCRLEYKPFTCYYKQNDNLNKNNAAEKSFDDFNKAKERIKQKIITADKTQDNSLLYTAMSQFKNNNE